MGFYFNGKNTREVVCHNFNTIRELFGLSSQKLADLMEPFAQIPYQKVRRLAAGERDITSEELNALYELLAVPPATFTFPWALPDRHTSTIQKLSHETHLTTNPIFDHLGTPLYPYEIYKEKAWLPAQLIREVLSNSECLFRIESEKTEKKYILEDFLEKKIQTYVRTLFPSKTYTDSLQPLQHWITPFSDNNPHITDLPLFLTYLGNAILQYARKEATRNFYAQLIRRTPDSIFLRCYEERSFARAYDHWNNDDHISGTLHQLIYYTECIDGEITLRISTTNNRTNNPIDQITLIAKDKDDAHIIGTAEIQFDYQDWFKCTKPTDIRMSGLTNKSATPDTNPITIWEGNLEKELANAGEPGYRRFPYLYPTFVTEY